MISTRRNENEKNSTKKRKKKFSIECARKQKNRDEIRLAGDHKRKVLYDSILSSSILSTSSYEIGHYDCFLLYHTMVSI